MSCTALNVCVADSGQVELTRRMAVEEEREGEDPHGESLCPRQQAAC